MSATLGALLRLVEPDWSITLVERLDAAAAESSDPWNNAGTGHSALCELNYTPEGPDGSIEIAKAVNVNEQFQVTRQFWAYAHEHGILPDVRSFLNPIPHVSFVQGAENVDYLRRRRDTLVRNPLFANMEFIDGADEFARRLPLMAEGRDFTDPVGLNWSQDGTDVDFGSLSRQLLGYGAERGMTTMFGHEVRDLRKESDGSWTVKIVNRRTGEKRKLHAKFVFVGAGGGALPLLQKSGMEEAKGFGGFPVSGEWLRTNNPNLTGAHHAKVYGLPPLGAPPMSMPHLDTRVINGQGLAAVRPVRRLVAEVPQGRQGHRPAAVGQAEQPRLDDRRRAHRVAAAEVPDRRAAAVARRTASTPSAKFAPTAQSQDWELDIAGQRVQVIRRDKKKLRCARVRHHRARRRRRVHRRPARRLTGRLDRGAGDARRDAALLPRPLPRLAAQAQGDGAVAGREALGEPGAVRRGLGRTAPRCSAWPVAPTPAAPAGRRPRFHPGHR